MCRSRRRYELNRLSRDAEEKRAAYHDAQIKSLSQNPWLGQETGHNNGFWDRH
jgi:hypothetical protein